MINQNDNNFDQNSNRHPIRQESENPLKKKDIFVSFISRRAEQLTTAVYLVTDNIDEKDPLRKYIRKITIGLLGSACELRSASTNEKPEIVSDIEVILRDLTTFITVARDSGNISTMNADILLSEISKTIASIFQHNEREYLKYKKREEGYVASYLLEQVFDGDSAVLDEEVESDNQAPAPQQNVTASTSAKQENQNDIPSESDRRIITNKNDIALKHLRRKTIIGIINDNGEVTINDIKKIINDVSEKTLQREILGLIEEGIILKTGEKRWAKYSIKHNK